LAALDRLPTGVLLIDAAGEATFANRAAQRMLESGDGLRLKKLTRASGLGNLSADNELTNRAIAAALRSTLSRDPFGTEHFSDSVLAPKSSGGAAYALQFSALGNQNEFGADSAASAIVFLADGAQQMEIDPALLQSAYGLSPAEARVANALLECGSAPEVADYLNVSPHTVRTQMKQIYAKLGVDTRARFVKLMMGLAKHRS
jgi:DNA-binding CsgD family transcriptional regulator